MPDDSVTKELIEKAFDMLNFSYTPYSNYRVGAALLTATGKIYTGCNIENIAFGPSNCAERTAFFKAVSEGEKEFAAIAIVGGPCGNVTDYCTPCGCSAHLFQDWDKPPPRRSQHRELRRCRQKLPLVL